MDNERKVEGGVAIPVYVIQNSDLVQNGGNFTVQGGDAVAVYVVNADE